MEYFLSVAQTLNFTKTANEKFVSQPAVSRQIASLEEELGVTLFKRESKGLSLTGAGTIIANYFETHRNNLASITQMVRENESEKKVSIRIGCGNGWCLNEFLPQINEKMTIKYPNLEFHIESYSFEQLVHALNEDNIDVAIGLSQNMYELATLEIQELTKIQRVLLYSVNNSVACEIKNPLPADFSGQRFFVFSNDNNILGLVSSYCKPYGFVPRIQIVNNLNSLFANVINGFGVAIVDQWTTRIHDNGFQYIPLESMHKVSLAWKRNNLSEMSSMFLEELKKFF